MLTFDDMLDVYHQMAIIHHDCVKVLFKKNESYDKGNKSKGGYYLKENIYDYSRKWS